MLEVIDASGKVVNRSRNLAGIRRYVSNELISWIKIDNMHNNARLNIMFADGARFYCAFASFDVLKCFVRQWRNVYGAPLIVNDKPTTPVCYNHSQLKD